MGQPGRHVDEIASIRGRAGLAVLAPTNYTLSLEHVRDRLLLSVMMNTCPGARLDNEYASPKRRFDAHVSGDTSTPFGAWCLRRRSVKLLGLYNPDRLISFHRHALERHTLERRLING